VLIETATLQDRARWKRLSGASDLVFADVLSFPEVQRTNPKCIRELRLVSPMTVSHLLAALEFVVPRSDKSSADNAD
jgi:hypothetical protein